MKNSVLIAKAKNQIQAVKGKNLSTQERKEAAIDLAAFMFEEAQRIQTPTEKHQQAQLAGMMNDRIGKVFTTALTDQCFRSRSYPRIANQLVHVIKKYGVPAYLPLSRRIALEGFQYLGETFSFLSVPMATEMLREETSHVILPGEEELLIQHMAKRRAEGVRINLNHLGEAILGEEEAKARLRIYLDDLAKPEVEYISIKISTIYSQINLLAWNSTLKILAERLRKLYRAASRNHYVLPDGTEVQKFVNLDMEEYRDLHMTVALFHKVLDEPEFFHHSAGIVLQSYLPDSFEIQQELTEWAMKRVAEGGAPIKIRIVKGANLAMEQLESALRLWPQAPYPRKRDVDANYKRMVTYGSENKRAEAANLGIASHNLFDIAYALLLRSENNAERYICFEMLEGMADPMRRVVQQLSGDMLLYCPAATKEEFQNAIAYLVRRLDENTAPENFLRHAFDLKVGSPQWQKQVALFQQACDEQETVSSTPRRSQDRSKEKGEAPPLQFQNEADTDFSLPQNIKWVGDILAHWKNKVFDPIPIVIGEKVLVNDVLAKGENPSNPHSPLYYYSLATPEQIEESLRMAKKRESHFAKSTVEERSQLLQRIAHGLRQQRAQLIGAMLADTGKTVLEADTEISEAIDFANYYSHNLLIWSKLPDISWSPKGTILVAPPWNFPCSIAAGGILAALAGGNCVIFKPAAEAVLVGWLLVQIFWEAGVSKEVLQFITCEDEPVGSMLIKDPRINTVVLTGATATAKLFLKMRPDLDLIAETGGKNTMVISSMADKDLAIKDLIHSAFSHAGQKCSACSLAILDAEVYDDPHFLKNLRDAAASLPVGTPWNLKTKVNPLIKAPQGALLRAFSKLEEGEEWLLQPQPDPNNPHLWTPGIKLGVTPEGITFQTELFGPLLGLVRARDFDDALDMVNQTPYGLTAGIHSLDTREQDRWLKKIEAGNCYINRTTTGAIVQRQPFGGTKDSSFGKGVKAGGPNYLTAFMQAKQSSLPTEQLPLPIPLYKFTEEIIRRELLSSEELALLRASAGSYAFHYSNYFKKDHDPSLVVGQDNLLRYVPHRNMIARIHADDTLVDVLRLTAAALTTHTSLELSIGDSAIIAALRQLTLAKEIKILEESDQEFGTRLPEGQRVRLFKVAQPALQQVLAEKACHLSIGPVLANGRIELLHLLREVSISRDYHRYGNLGEREHEQRHPGYTHVAEVTLDPE